MEGNAGSSGPDNLSLQVPAHRHGDNFYPGTPNVMGARLPEANAITPEGARRSRGLSPEERKALRRQIDEAGHDIYTPRR